MEYRNRRVIRTFQHGKEGDLITNVAFSPDDRLIATADRNNAKVWRVADGSLLWEFPQDIMATTYTNVDFLPNRTQLMVSGANGASIRDLVTGAQVHFFPGSEWTEEYGPQLSPDGRYVTTRESDTAEVFVWDDLTGTLIRHFTNARRAQMPISFVSSSEVAFNEKEALTLWDIQSGQQKGSLELGEGFTEEWRFSPNGSYALIFRDIGQTSHEYTTDLWDVDSRQKIYPFDPFFLRNSLFLPGGDNLLIVAPDRDQQAFQASIWNVPSRSITRSFPVDSEVITSASTHDGHYWIASMEDSNISVWDLRTGQRTRILC